jgi:PAS domain S-box-containing protein
VSSRLPENHGADPARPTVEDLARRVELERLIVDIATRFNRLGPMERIDMTIRDALRDIATCAGLEGIYIVLLQPEQAAFTEAYDWHAPGIPSFRDRYQNQPLSAFPWLAGQLIAEKTVVVPDIEDLPPEADAERRFIGADGVKAFVLCPMFSGPNALGCLGFERYSSPCAWPGETVRSFQLAAASFAALVARRSAEESYLVAQRDLGLALAEAKTLEDALCLCLRSAIAVAGMDSGGAYEVNADGSLTLVCHEGLSEAFVGATSGYDRTSANAGLVRKGEPLYLETEVPVVSFKDLYRTEGLKTLAMIPVLARGEAVACLNVASHSRREIPTSVRRALEGIGSRIGNAIVRVRAEEALRESEARNADLVNWQNAGIYSIRVSASPDWFATTPPTFHYEFVSDRYCAMFGHTREELLRDPGLTLRQLHPDDAQEFLQLNVVAARSTEPFTWLGRMIIAGETRWIHFESRARRLESGETLWTGIAIDVTERRRAEEAQREQEALVRFISGNLPAMLYQILLHPDGHRQFTYVSEAVQQLHGCTAEEAMADASRIYGTVVEEDQERIRAEEDRAAQAFDTFRSEVRVRDPAGGVRWSYFASTPRRLQGGLMIWDGMEIDITERRRLEERLRQTEKMEAIGQLAGGVAHDFNNQLAGIMGYAELLERRLDDPHDRRFAERIISTASRAAELAAQLLAFARKGNTISAPVNLHDIVHEVVSILAHSIDRRIRIRQHLDASPPWTVGDPTALQNALLNLGLNARDAMPEGGELVFATSVEALPVPGAPPDLPPGRYVRLDATDSGAGMTEETQRHLFEPFFTTKERGKGTGLGLAAVYGIVQNHRGAITVRSAPGRGTTFAIYLPASEPPAGAQPTDAGATATPRRVRVLLADDEAPVRETVSHRLRGEGHTVVTAEDGVEALRYYEASWREIDLVILDLMMPRMGGRDAFVAMRRINPDLRALVISGYSVEGEAQEMLEAGVLGFLQKPFQGEALVRMVADLFPAGGPASSPRP